jgi:CDP-diacylglycerol--glycerol-3-phosphate 3-phosphatidyltransferase
MKPALPDHVGDPATQGSVWNVPNALTVIRLLLVPVFGWLLLRDGGTDTASRVLAAAVFLVATLTDLADGAIARSRNLITTFGKVADPIADKALTAMALIGLSYLGELPWWITLVILAREIGVTVLRFWVIRHGVIPASRGGKAKTLLQNIAILGYVLPFTGWLHTVAEVLMYAAVVVTIVTGLDYVVRAVRLRRDSLHRSATS